jgi:glycosyltransferase involved in cell wall biosynthesis
LGKDKKILVVSFQSLSAHSGEGMARLGYFLSEKLNEKGILKEFVVSSKGKHVTPFPSSAVSSLSRYYLFALNKLVKLFKIKEYKSRFIQEKLFDRFLSQHVTDDVTAIVSTNSYLPKTFKKAKKKGIKTYLVPANPEDNFIYQLMLEEQDKLGIHFTDAYTYKPRLDYYNECVALADKIIGSTPVTYETYLKRHGAEKIVYLPGHLKPGFKPAAALPVKTEGPFNVCYIAYTVLLKGLHYLLEAWQNIMQQPGTDELHLYIGGNVFGLMDDYIKKTYPNLKNVHWEGHISNVPKFLENKHLFAGPSLVEGGPITALEAMHYGVPVMVTENCGAKDFVKKENTGWTVPIRDAKAIEAVIMEAYKNRADIVTTGLNAKKELDGYKMEDLIDDLANYFEKN